MANPQKEHGYTPIANELLEAIIQSQFNATQLRILLLTMRCTFGYSKKECRLSVSYISKGTGISKRYVVSELNKLIDWKVIEVIREHTDTESRIIRINKNYDTWSNGRIVQQVKNSSTVDELINTTDEEQFTPTDEEYFTTTDEQYFTQKNNNKTIYKYIDHFNEFWRVYPKKVAKASAEKSFKKLKVDDELLNKMIQALEIQKQSKQWRDKQFIPHASTWLNQRRWEDEEDCEQVPSGIKMEADGAFQF